MTRLTSSLVILGIILLILMPIWTFLVIPEITKMPSTFYHYEEQTGMNSIAPYVGASLPAPFEHRDIQEIKVINHIGKDLKILSTLKATNVNTGEVFLEESRLFDVDRQTRSHTSVEKGYFWFPPNTQPQNYFLTFPLSFSHAIFTFQGIDVIDGLETDVFICETKPYEIWRYESIEGGVIFIFGDITGFSDYQLLHSTKRGELRDEYWVRRIAVQ